MQQSSDRIKIHIARKELLLDDQPYRDILRENFNGAESSKDLDDEQVKKLIRIFQSRGWQQKRPAVIKNGREGHRKVNDNFRKVQAGPYAAMQRKVLALWAELGYDVKKLDTRVKKQFNIDRIEWLRDYEQLHVLITDLANRVRAL